uniref:Uncharacterized protein n=1 Tax=Anguilla anguilla TaxID=7936 RepID=A0A0E9QLC6_ANGAN
MNTYWCFVLQVNMSTVLNPAPRALRIRKVVMSLKAPLRL